MVNMYSIGGMMGGYGSGGNVYQNLKNKYAVGYEDVGLTPSATTYSIPVKPRSIEANKPLTFWQKLFKSFYI